LTPSKIWKSTGYVHEGLDDKFWTNGHGTISQEWWLKVRYTESVVDKDLSIGFNAYRLPDGRCEAVLGAIRDPKIRDSFVPVISVPQNQKATVFLQFDELTSPTMPEEGCQGTHVVS
jgi:hypothetical protein